jgi:hypothetical protein
MLGGLNIPAEISFGYHKNQDFQIVAPDQQRDIILG